MIAATRSTSTPNADPISIPIPIVRDEAGIIVTAARIRTIGLSGNPRSPSSSPVTRSDRKRLSAAASSLGERYSNRNGGGVGGTFLSDHIPRSRGRPRRSYETPVRQYAQLHVGSAPRTKYRYTVRAA